MCIIVFKTTNTKLVLKTKNIVLKPKNKSKGLGIAQSMTFASYLIIKKCSMHINVTSVCGQFRKIKAFKAMCVILKQKPEKNGGTERMGKLPNLPGLP